MRRTIAALVLFPALLGAAGVAQASTSTASDANASSFVSKTNAERQARGLKPYTVKSDLAAVAARHSQRMASKQDLYHNPNLGSEVSGWRIVGENVGTGGTVDSIHQEFMDSPLHRSNILDRDFTEIGIGTVTDGNGRMWVTQVFRLPQSAPRVSAPVTTTASRSIARTPVRTTVKPVVKAAVQAPKKPVRTLVAVTPDAAALAGALAGQAATYDSLTLALMYAETMGALAR